MSSRTDPDASGEQRAIDYLSQAERRLSEASKDGDASAANALAHVSDTLQTHDNRRQASSARRDNVKH